MIAAVLVLVDPVLVQQSTLVMTETIAAFLAAVVMLAWNQIAIRTKSTRFVGWSIVLAGALALAYLCRPTFLVWAGCLMLLLFMASRRDKSLISAAAIIFLLVGGTLAVWTLRNQRQLGAPVWATTHGGYTLLLANNPLFYDYLRDGNPAGDDDRQQPWNADAFTSAYLHRYDGDPTTDEFWRRDWQAVAVAETAISEPTDDKRCGTAAIATIKRQPGMFVWSSLVRVGRLWSPFPHQVPGRSLTLVWIVGVYYVVFFVLVLVAIVRLRSKLFQRRFWAILSLVFTLTAVHAVYWSNLRMRAPATAGLAVMVGLAITPRNRNQDV